MACKLGKLRTLARGSSVGEGVGDGSIFQMSWQYSLMVRSLENLPDIATPIIAILFQAYGSRYALSTRSCASI